MAFDDRIDLLTVAEKPREVVLPMVPERDLGEDSQRLPQLGDVDLGRIAGDEALRLKLLHPHQAGARRKMDQVGKLDVGYAPVLLQFG